MTQHSLGARVQGRITSILIREGERVKKGQLVATLDRLNQAQRDYDRLKQIFSQGGAAQQDVEHALLEVEDQKVVSPVEGVVLVKVHESGEVVGAGGIVAVIGDEAELWVKIFVPEGVINTIHMNQPVELFFDGVKQIFSGHVSFISSQAEFTPRNVQTIEERVTQTFAVKVTVDHPPDFLRPGVAADVAFVRKK